MPFPLHAIESFLRQSCGGGAGVTLRHLGQHIPRFCPVFELVLDVTDFEFCIGYLGTVGVTVDHLAELAER